MSAACLQIGLAFGSNIGDKAENIRSAIDALSASHVVEITTVSSLYRTPPWGYLAQEDFANACALGLTSLSPHALLAHVKRIETKIGREPGPRWGPRLIDIDILFYGDVEIETADLTVPHNDLFSRAFVLLPLAEIAPDLILRDRSVRDAAAAIARDGIVPWAPDSIERRQD